LTGNASQFLAPDATWLLKLQVIFGLRTRPL